MGKDSVPRFLGWEYAKKGDYHHNLDPNWSYTPTYLQKRLFVEKMIWKLSPEARILDAGCGEGVLVEKFKAMGRRIEGIDLNYESDNVRRGSILNLPYADASFEMVLLLDVLEHLTYGDQPLALAETHRVLKKGGSLLASIPNLAHLNSRFRFGLLGRLDRTDTELNHLGERPAHENRRLLEKAGFRIAEVKGVTLTLPVVYRQVICRWPAKYRWLHDLLEPLAFPSLSMINLFLCRKP